MKNYKCHKTVRAGKITAIENLDGHIYYLKIEDREDVVVTDDFINRHKPRVGGYYVRYQGGYASFSPAEAFESGYTDIMDSSDDPCDYEILLNRLRDALHNVARDHGWHDDALTPEQFLALQVPNIHGEVSELWEALRRGELNKPCDKSGCDLSCKEEELADIVIRVFDICGRLNINIGRAILEKSRYNETRPYRHGNKKA